MLKRYTDKDLRADAVKSLVAKLLDGERVGKLNLAEWMEGEIDSPMLNSLVQACACSDREKIGDIGLEIRKLAEQKLPDIFDGTTIGGLYIDDEMEALEQAAKDAVTDAKIQDALEGRDG